MKSQQSGFAHAVLIIGLIVALVGALGFVYWQNFVYEEPTATKTEIVKVDKNVPKEESDSPSPSQSPDVRLKELYAKYLADTTAYKGDSGLTALKQSGYISADYVTENNSGEPLVCGQEAYPDSMEVKLVSVNETTATLSADKIYNDGSKPSIKLVLTMSISSANEWQLQKTSCMNN